MGNEQKETTMYLLLPYGQKIKMTIPEEIFEEAWADIEDMFRSQGLWHSQWTNVIASLDGESIDAIDFHKVIGVQYE